MPDDRSQREQSGHGPAVTDSSGTALLLAILAAAIQQRAKGRRR